MSLVRPATPQWCLSVAQAHTVTKSITIKVGNVNRPPQLMPIGDRAVIAGTTVTFTLTAADPDGDALSFPVPTALPDGAALTDNSDCTAVFNWTPAAAQAGTTTLEFTTTDGSETASESVVLTVAARPAAASTTAASSGGGATGLGELLVLAMAVMGLRRRTLQIRRA